MDAMHGAVHSKGDRYNRDGITRCVAPHSGRRRVWTMDLGLPLRFTPGYWLASLRDSIVGTYRVPGIQAARREIKCLALYCCTIA
jgi:hypothetical protein